MAGVEVEDVATVKVSGGEAELWSTSRNMYKLVQIFMKPMCIMYEVPFQRPLEAPEHSSEYVGEGTHGVICYPSYNTCKIEQPSNLEHDSLGVQNMSGFVELLSPLKDLGAHEYMFCSGMQLRTMYQLLVA